MERKYQGNCKAPGHLKIPNKSVGDSIDDEDKLNIYEGNSKAWDFLIIRLIEIPFWLVSQCDENSHEACKALIDRYEVSD